MVDTATDGALACGQPATAPRVHFYLVKGQDNCRAVCLCRGARELGVAAAEAAAACPAALLRAKRA